MVLPPNQSLLPAPEKKLNRVKPIVEALDKVYEELSPTSPPVVLKEKRVILEFFFQNQKTRELTVERDIFYQKLS